MFTNCLKNVILNMGDWLLMLEISKNGKVYYFKDFFLVYRIHENGVWSGKDSV